MTTVTRAKVLRGDVNWFDGVNQTASRLDATGGTVTGLRVGDEVDILQLFGSGTNRGVATINNAITAVGSSACQFVFSTGTWTIDSDVTIPSTVSIHVTAGCVFNISSSITLTFSGPVHVDYVVSDGTGWYTGSGSVLCSQGASGFPGW